MTDRSCAACGAPLPDADPRRRYCSAARRMRAHRARRARPARAPEPAPAITTSRVYECPRCEQRRIDERRCPECHLFCRALGPGGECPCCGQPVAISELLGEDHPTAGRDRPPHSGALAFGSAPSGGGRNIAEEGSPM